MNDSLLSRVLIPLDGTPHAEEILSQLRRILPRHDTQLILLHAIPLVPLAGGQDPDQYLRKITFQLTNEGFPSKQILRKGAPADMILETAKEAGATMIAICTRGLSGPARWVLGSVAEKVLHSSPLPVLVARSFPPGMSRGRLEAKPVRKFLVPLDGSRQSLGVLDPLLRLARPVDAHVTLLHVTEPSPYDGRWDERDETMAEAERLLRESCIPATVEHRKGEPGEQILRAVEEHGIDLIGMTTHGRSGAPRWILGSVTATLMQTASVPLMVVRNRPVSAAQTPAILKTSAS